MNCFLLKEVLTNVSKGDIKEAISLVEWLFEQKDIEEKKENKHLGQGSPYNVLWRADLRFYLSQGLAVAGLKVVADMKEAISQKNDIKKVRQEVIELQMLVCRLIKVYQRLSCLETRLDQPT